MKTAASRRMHARPMVPNWVRCRRSSCACWCSSAFHVQPVDVEQRGEFPERLFVVVVDPLVIQVDEVLQVLIGGPEVAECCVGVRAGFVNIVEIRFRVAFVPEQSDQSLDRCECLGVFVRGFVDRQLDFGQVDIGEVTAVSGLDLFEQGFGLGDLVGLEK